VKGLAQGSAEDALGAAEDGSLKVFIVVPAPTSCPSLSSSGGIHAKHTRSAPLACPGRHMKDEHVKEVAQDAGEDVPQDVPRDVPQDVAQYLTFGGPGGARPSRHATTTAAAVFT